MRITSAQVFRAQIEQAQRAARDSFRAQQVAVSGRRLLSPSDDPAGAQRASLLRDLRSELAASDGMAGAARAELASADEALASMGDALSRLRELAVQMATDTASTEDRAAAAAEAQQLKEAVIAYGNARHGDKYLFSGQITDGSAFDAAGAYQGNAAEVEVQFGGGGPSVAVTLRGDEVLRGASSGPDVIVAIDDFIAALSADDTVAIQSSLDTLADGFDHVVSVRSEVGARMEKLRGLQDHWSRLDLALLLDQARIEDADPVQALSDVVRTQQAYQTVLQVTAAARTQTAFDILF
jgi:flagellar hook-associated protein 3 FlgL